MNHSEILLRFLEHNINIHPTALDEIERLCSTNMELDKLLRKTKEKSPSVVTPEFVKEIDEKDERLKPVIKRRKSTAEEIDSQIKIHREKDITSKSFTSGQIGNFVDFFNIRYEKLAKILKKRETLASSSLIEVVKNRPSEEGQIIGIVNDIRQTKNRHIFLVLEDPSGTIKALIPNKDEALKRKAKEVVKDEIVGLKGTYRKELFIIEEIFFPDLPHNREIRKSPEPVALALISDLHVGNMQFLEDTFLKFVRWLRLEEGGRAEKELATKVKYIVIGGDVVDGVGIYPEQKDELVIKNIKHQYSKFYQYLEMLPDYIDVIICPGNHDATRQAEPQPAISEEFAPQYYEDQRVHMAGNPMSLELHGVRVTSYHGRSLDDIISAIPGMKYSRPAKPMLSLLKKRHLSPLYGGKVPLAPEKYDYLLIEEPPEILHMGHVHTTDSRSYRNSLIINSGTFQAQTAFQKRMNIQPTPGRVPIVDLNSLKMTVKEF